MLAQQRYRGLARQGSFLELHLVPVEQAGDLEVPTSPSIDGDKEDSWELSGGRVSRDRERKWESQPGVTVTLHTEVGHSEQSKSWLSQRKRWQMCQLQTWAVSSSRRGPYPCISTELKPGQDQTNHSTVETCEHQNSVPCFPLAAAMGLPRNPSCWREVGWEDLTNHGHTICCVTQKKRFNWKSLRSFGLQNSLFYCSVPVSFPQLLMVCGGRGFLGKMTQSVTQIRANFPQHIE